MKNIIAISLTIALLSPFANASVITNVDFSGISGDFIFTSLTHNGVEMNSSVGPNGNSFLFSGFGVWLGNNTLTITKTDNSYFNLLDMSWMYITGQDEVLYSDSNGNNFSSQLLSLDQTNFGLFGQNTNQIMVNGTSLDPKLISSFSLQSVSVPEPSSFALFGLGLMGLGFAKRRA